MTLARPRSISLLAALAVALCASLPPASRADARADGERGIEAYRKGNLIEGMALLERSAAAGYAPAQTTLAFILDAAEQDESAVRWYRAAAEGNDAEGLFGLGGMVAKGEGTERDPLLAGQLIHRAALLGHRQATRVYAHALEHGQLGLAAAPAQAADWYLRAARLGDRVAMQRLQRAYDDGQLGLPADARRAAEWAAKSRGGE